ncbi:MAG TPA: tetratricopeptide repeat protein [Terriglobales bacterium]|nr:tetratricopeptide repeat protein [Terriglobales bacterium]
MTNQATESRPKQLSWQPRQVYVMAAVCLAVGLLVGYLLRGSAKPAGAILNSAATADSPAGMNGGAPAQMTALDQMKQVADSQAEPLLTKLATDPKNAGLLIQIGNIYKAAHQFKQAADYYGKALNVDARNVAIRTEMASCLYYSGDVNGALDQLQQSLKYDPRDANSLFNLGMIRWKGKNDAAGAIAAWQQLLKTNPNLDKKAIVEKMIAEARQPRAN